MQASFAGSAPWASCLCLGEASLSMNKMSVHPLFVPTLLLGALAFYLGYSILSKMSSLGKRLAWLFCFALLGLPAACFVLYYLHLIEEPLWLYRYRSWPGTELSAALAGLCAGGLAVSVQKSPRVSSSFLFVILMLGLSIPYLKPLLAPLPEDWFHDSWSGRVCLQSTPSTCGPASAATILHYWGMPVSEQTLARECFSYSGGTENWFLARAFRRRGLQVQYRLEDRLPEDLHLPAIAGVRVAGHGHFIALLQRKGDRWLIGDPLRGEEELSLEALRAQQDFTGFFMEISLPGS